MVYPTRARIDGPSKSPGRVKELGLHSTINLPADCSSGLRAKGINPERDQRAPPPKKEGEL